MPKCVGHEPGCPLCKAASGDCVWQGPALRVVLPDEPDFPGFTRVVWQAHVAEMTDLPAADRRVLMDAVWTVETTMRRVLAPDKVNLASLGNAVPHLHWHLVPRWADDARFPGSPWSSVRADRDDDASLATAAAAMTAAAAATARRRVALALLPAYRRALIEAFGASGRPI